MKSLKLGLPAFGLLAAFQFVAPEVSNAQYWRAMPSTLTPETSQILSFSQDEKHVFFTSTENGMSNIYRVPVKGGAAEPITSYTEGKIYRAIATVGRPFIVFMRPIAGEGDHHLFIVMQDGKSAPRDVTPTKPGVNNVIVGASYTGRYVYYTSNQTSADKHDVYRYDVWQNISELVYANTKDYQPVHWNKTQTAVTLYSPAMRRQMTYDINTTETQESEVEPEPDFEVSINGRFHVGATVLDTKSNEKLAIESPMLIGVAPKETMIAYTVKQSDGSSKLFVYDVNKKTSTELAVVK